MGEIRGIMSKDSLYISLRRGLPLKLKLSPVIKFSPRLLKPVRIPAKILRHAKGDNVL